MFKQMMDTSSDPGENQFFDALEEISSNSDSGFDCFCSNSACGACCSVSSSAQFDVWIQNPESVQARRSKFFNWLGLDVNKISGDHIDGSCDPEKEDDWIDTSFECEFSSSRCPVSFCSRDDSELSKNLIHKESMNVGMPNVGGDNRETSAADAEQSERSSSSSSCADFSHDKYSTASSSVGPSKRVKKWWMNRLRSLSCVMEGEHDLYNCDSSAGGRIQRVKVHQSKKQSNELSALYYGQNIQAHEGAILTMKFSPDGRFLASAGEDRIVRVWQVVEDDRSNELDIPETDPSCVYFTMNHLSELNPFSTDKEKSGKLKRTPDSACVILPPKVFRIMEKPLHEFQGHSSEVLDLSWSKSDCLLSASVDKTVRLWRVGINHCLKVFPHNNYVTCIQFNPVDDNCFISGSIDGKVRVWEISHCKVVNWIETKDIVTAVCYRPDGQGGIIGSLAGSFRFYNISDDQLEVEAPVFLDNKKKSSGKRITGFQFFPQDPSKVMISCADSQVRILQGANVIGKFKGQRRTGAHCTASFTADGKHIVAASEDANVYVWKCNDRDYTDSSRIKKIKSSERFLSNASVALPWPGLQNENNRNQWHSGAFNGLNHGSQPYFSPPHFSCKQDFFLELYYPKGAALWPEEKLVSSSPSSLTSSMHKSEYRFLKTCQSRTDSDAWGMVIVTAGWDGKIKSFHNYGLPVPH
ncbi:WD repeat-containing protein YMR102C-like [Amaranthus tricolor]|uniref:WD repeat-containing protein YMR102C-like n=1 Tax=Amaranthus tricolor TaxID=29722 RepID=UPI0025893CF0|nr:WD repeat-containing protein YMR102C-like [Amaranthus tricolor]XP_057522144.1 WD repeat-containing protein YMR102C-like [Amaranthus tricolor]